MIYQRNKEKYSCSYYHEYKNGKYSVQSSLKSHPLWVTLYLNLTNL